MAAVLRNGELVDRRRATSPVDSGWGVFTTAGCDHGRPLLWPRHRKRLQSSLEELGGSGARAIPDEQELSDFLAAENLSGAARLRVVARRSTSSQWIVETSAEACRCDGPNLEPAELATERWPAAPPLIGHKTLSRLPWDLARERALARGADDVLLVDESGAVLETAISNVWVVRNGVVSTPPAPLSCLPGVMRAWLLENLAGAGISAVECALHEDALAEADEVWLSNAVMGVRRVGRLAASSWLRWPVFERLSEIGIPAPAWPSSGS